MEKKLEEKLDDLLMTEDEPPLYVLVVVDNNGVYVRTNCMPKPGHENEEAVRLILEEAIDTVDKGYFRNIRSH